MAKKKSKKIILLVLVALVPVFLCVLVLVGPMIAYLVAEPYILSPRNYEKVIDSENYEYIQVIDDGVTANQIHYVFQKDVGQVTKDVNGNVVRFEFKDSIYQKNGNTWEMKLQENEHVPGSLFEFLNAGTSLDEIKSNTKIAFNERCEAVEFGARCESLIHTEQIGEFTKEIRTFYSIGNKNRFPEAMTIQDPGAILLRTYFFKDPLDTKPLDIQAEFNNTVDLQKQIKEDSITENSELDTIEVVGAVKFLYEKDTNFTDQFLPDEKTEELTPLTDEQEEDAKFYQSLGGMIIFLPFISLNLVLAVIVLNISEKKGLKNKFLWPILTIFGGIVMFGLFMFNYRKGRLK